MEGGAFALASELLESAVEPDLILASDMLDVATFLGLTKSRTAGVPCITYFHENQFAYPWSANDRDYIRGTERFYSLKNVAAALASDCIAFNSNYNCTSFFDGAALLFERFPDYNDFSAIARLKPLTRILPVGIQDVFFELDQSRPGKSDKPLILWNHRWESDKNPKEFFELLESLSRDGISFELAVLGEALDAIPREFIEAKESLARHIVHWGYVDSFAEYREWLCRADFMPVTSKQDFFGVSIAEAIACGVVPLLPDRLSYPEVFSIGSNPEFFYRSNDELARRLRHLLQGIDRLDSSALRELVGGYRWSNVVSEYDSLFSEYIDRD